MAVDPSVRIDIAAEFTGKKAFDKAGKSTSSLEKNVKNLAKTFGVAFGGKALLNFAKSSAKAFIEDENAARSLGVTIKNLFIKVQYKENNQWFDMATSPILIPVHNIVANKESNLSVKLNGR